MNIEYTKGWIETALDNDAHAPGWPSHILFKDIEFIAEKLASRIVFLTNEVQREERAKTIMDAAEVLHQKYMIAKDLNVLNTLHECQAELYKLPLEQVTP